MNPMPILGREYLDHLWKIIGTKLKAAARPLFRDGIGDRMDKGNLWLVPGFTLFVFAILWTTKLSRIALDESNCKGASIYDFTGTLLDEDAKRHCQTAKRYWLSVEEPFPMNQYSRVKREVKNPEWILWFWAPIVFVMYVLTRFIWSILMENQGINFQNVINVSQSVLIDEDGITLVDENTVIQRVSIIEDNFRCAYSSRAFGAFLAFELGLVLAPLLLLLLILPLMIGVNYRSWGLDVFKAWWESHDWQGSPLIPFFDYPKSGTMVSAYDEPSTSPTFWHFADHRRMVVPLIPRITYCDYNFVSLGNSHTLTYRCYLDANWHERTALFTWLMLVFLTLINIGNLLLWFEWAFRMRNRGQRRGWVSKKWLNSFDLSDPEYPFVGQFSESFTMGQLLYFYYIEAHSDRVVATAFCTVLFERWLDRFKKYQREQRARYPPDGRPPPPGLRMPPKGNGGSLPEFNQHQIHPISPHGNAPLGWTVESDNGHEQQQPQPLHISPTAPAFDSATTALVSPNSTMTSGGRTLQPSNYSSSSSTDSSLSHAARPLAPPSGIMIEPPISPMYTIPTSSKILGKSRRRSLDPLEERDEGRRSAGGRPGADNKRGKKDRRGPPLTGGRIWGRKGGKSDVGRRNVDEDDEDGEGKNLLYGQRRIPKESTCSIL